MQYTYKEQNKKMHVHVSLKTFNKIKIKDICVYIVEHAVYMFYRNLWLFL